MAEADGSCEEICTLATCPNPNTPDTAPNTPASEASVDNSDTLQHFQLPLSTPIPDQLTTPPNTPVMYVQNPYYCRGASTARIPAQSSPYATTTISVPPLTHRFPVASVPLIAPVGNTTTYSTIAQCPYTSALPIYTPPLSPFATMTRSFPLVQATFLSPSSAYYPSQEMQLTTPNTAYQHPAFPQNVADFQPFTIPPSNTSGNVARPPYSFSALIAMAILSSPKKMLTLPEIYDFITNKFSFYQKEDKKWKNSVRHNLSLNKCFKKAPRKGKHSNYGKGNYWMIDPDCSHVLENGSFRSPANERKKRKEKASKKSRESDQEEEYGTKAIFNPNTATAEIIIPPIQSTDAELSGSTSSQPHSLSGLMTKQEAGYTLLPGRATHPMPSDSLKFGVEKLLS